MAEFETLMPIRTKGTDTPIFFVHGEPLRMAQRMQPTRPIYGLSHVYRSDFSKKPESIEKLAAVYLSEVQEVQPTGPYHLCGFSAGGMLAFEMARQIRAQGQDVAGLTLIEPTYISENTAQRVMSEMDRKDSALEKLLWLIGRIPVSLFSRAVTLSKMLRARIYWLFKIPIPDDWRWIGYLKSLGPAMNRYRYQPVDSGGTVLYGNIEPELRDEYREFWMHMLGPGGRVEFFDNVSTHEEFMLDPALGQTVAIIEQTEPPPAG